MLLPFSGWGTDVKLATAARKMCTTKRALSKTPTAPLSGNLPEAVPRNQTSGVKVQATSIELCDWASQPSFSSIFTMSILQQKETHILPSLICPHMGLAPHRRPTAVMELILPMTHRCRQNITKSPNPPLCNLLGLGWFTDSLSQASSILDGNCTLVCKTLCSYKTFSCVLFHSILPLTL